MFHLLAGFTIWERGWITGRLDLMRWKLHLAGSRLRAGSTVTQRVIPAPVHLGDLRLPTLMPHPLAYVFKRELLFIPFGWAMARPGHGAHRPQQRAEASTGVAEQGRCFMEQNNWVIMFPEGTWARCLQGQYKMGAARLAQATDTFAAHRRHLGLLQPRKSFVLRPGVIDVSFGPLPGPRGDSLRTS